MLKDRDHELFGVLTPVACLMMAKQEPTPKEIKIVAKCLRYAIKHTEKALECMAKESQ